VKRKVLKLLNVNRLVGWGSCVPKPPESLIGKFVTITRPLIAWDGCWVKYKKEKYVLANEEIGL
jgi:hypothetical protein